MQYDLASLAGHADYVQGLRAVLNTLPPKVQCKLLHRITHNYRDLLEEHERELNRRNPFARYVASDQLRRFQAMMARCGLLRSQHLRLLPYTPKVRWW